MVRPIVPRSVKILLGCTALGGATAVYLRYEEKAHRLAIIQERERVMTEKQRMIALKYTDMMDIPQWKVYCRIATLTLMFMPLVASSPLLVFHRFRPYWYRALRWLVQRSGPAFIKWGQWLTTRKDVFPEELRDIMTGLYNQVTPHGMAHNEATILQEFGKPLSEIFSSFDPKPVGSGSIAQVHRAVLRSTGETVAVKICHPHVRDNIALDFRCFLEFAKLLVAACPSLRWLDIVGTCRQFIEHLALQVDLTIEAQNLQQFRENFANFPELNFPKVYSDLVAKSVIVEEFIPGVPMWPYLKPGMPYSRRLCERGLAGWLKMILHDNFMHSDLHPGNILIDFRGMPPEECEDPKVTLVDCGLVLHFTTKQRSRLLSFIQGLALRDPDRVGNALLNFSDEQPQVDRAAWLQEVRNVFGTKYKRRRRHYVGKVTEVLSDLLDLVKKHRVRLDVEYSNLLFSTMLQESFINTLDPDFDVIGRAKPLIFKDESTLYQWLPRLPWHREKETHRGIV
eukprot:TRINITY_DN22578_c0_g1_i1.p1 TRINITY_DN22578_c0_g1~~TRINITY_DN22578_c0_g1_i1.p1  ORF type:complete len:510 (+),score=120.58 TRINITY_DN22578_c0_g1_i1:189-1718(+)